MGGGLAEPPPASGKAFRTSPLLGLRQKPAIRGDICSESPPKVCEIDMAQGQDMSKGPGTEEIMFLSAFILEI